MNGWIHQFYPGCTPKKQPLKANFWSSYLAWKKYDIKWNIFLAHKVQNQLTGDWRWMEDGDH